MTFALAVLPYGYVALGAVHPAQPVAPQQATASVAPSNTPSGLSPEPSDPSPKRALLDTYCVGCHNQRAKTANVMFDTMDLAHLSDNAEVWEKAVRKLQGGMMPPPGVRRPDQAAVNGFVSWLEDSLDQAAAAHPNPGRVALHRLNRAEYANAIEDLLGLHIDAGAFLPQDDEADGFDNVATVLKVSPSFLDQYISAARVVSTRALGNPSPRPGSATYRPPRGTDQGVHVDGLPLGTRGGLQVEHLFPSDGDYKLNVGGLATAGYVRGMEYRHTLVATIDGARVFEAQIGGEEDLRAIDQQQAPAVAAINGRFQNIPVKVTAGPHKVGVTFVARSYAESDEVLHSFRPGVGEERIPRVGSLEVVGPFNPAGVGETPSRRRIFVCSPTSAGDELPCATKVFSTFARRAFRRSVTDHDLEAPLGFYRTARETGDFDAGIRAGLTAILASPKFLFRAEQLPENVAPGSIYRISDLDLASRLAFFLTSRLPDDELLGVAEKNRLADPQVLEAQVRRLLADPRSKSLVTSFAFQWLKVRAIDTIDPDAVLFPNFDDGLRDAFRREMELFVDSILREDRSVLDLLTADHTFVNERLALHYGIPNVRGDRFRRVTLADSNRWGLLGKGGVLMATSYANLYRPGAARRMDSGQHPRDAAGGSAARCGGVQGEQGRREVPIGARDHGAAPQQALLQRLPRRHGSARFFAREFRRDRRVALEGSVRGHADRCVGQARGRHAGQRARRPAQRPDETSRAVRPDADREAHDLRAWKKCGVLRHADGSRHCPRRGARQLPLLVDRDGDCQEPGVSDAKGPGERDSLEA